MFREVVPTRFRHAKPSFPRLPNLMKRTIVIGIFVVLLSLLLTLYPSTRLIIDPNTEVEAHSTDKPTRQMSASPLSGSTERVVVAVGGGLAGLTAAISAREEALRLGVSIKVILLEKMPRLGGNSAKASSGINALNIASGDSVQLFKQDTLASGGGLSSEELVDHLVGLSQDALASLKSAGVDLSKFTQLGGHSAPRSFFNAAGPNVGLAIMQALSKKAQQLPGIQIREGVQVQEIIVNNGRATGIRVKKTEGSDGEQDELITCDAVVLATGGFAANKSMLELYNPVAAALATTNGPWAQGEVLAMAQAVGANLVHMENVQIHPTGFVDPKDPDAGTKWLAPEKFRGVGAILLNTEGRRFVDELSTRDVVSDAMLRQPGKRAFLLLGPSASSSFGIKTLDFYSSKGMMSRADTLAELAAITTVPEGALETELRAYNDAVASKEDAFGKKVFPSAHEPSGPFYVGTVVPVVHYTMGGVQIDRRAQVLGVDGRVIPGLFAAGEVSGGVHGRNRLGGNSLLECAVFGHIAGVEAAALASRGLDS